MKFDSNLAWQQASGAISANREVLFALAGVFFLLPGLVSALLFPTPPQPAEGMTSEAALAAMSSYYAQILPYMVPILLFQGTGTLALLTLMTDRSQPTVGEAIGMGFKGIVPYMLAQLMLGFAVGVFGGLLLAVAAATGVGALTVLALAGVLALAVYAMIRTSLVAPVIAVEGERNPLAALKRSWNLTRGNSMRLGVFFLLVLIVFLVVTMVISVVVGILAASIVGTKAAAMTGAVISSALGAVMALYFAAIVAAAHRQLGGSSADETRKTFE